VKANGLWLGAGAVAIAAASVFTPVLAQADNGNDGVGGSAGTPNPAQASRGGVSRSQAAANTAAANADNSPAAPGRSANAKAAVGAQANTGSNPLIQNPLWWFGTPNPDAPPPAYKTPFEPLANLPGWSQQYYGWYRDMNFEVCVLGLATTVTPSIGPYGTATNSVSTGGC
jgi:hypothetical protein